MKKLWDTLSSHEKEAYFPKKDKSDTDETNIPDNNNKDDGVNPDEIPDHCATQTGLTTIVWESNDKVTRKNGFRTSSCNLTFSKGRCNEFVATFIKKVHSLCFIHVCLQH